MKLRFLLIFLAAVLPGCSSRPASLRSSELYRQANSLKLFGPCAPLVPLEYEGTFPIPSDKTAKTWEVLYYAELPERYAPRHSIETPRFAGFFVLGSTVGARCVDLHPQKTTDVGLAAPPPFFKNAYARRLLRTYQGLELAGRLYFEGKPVGPKDREDLGRFVAAFRAAAEPALLGEYYKMNPGFWEWLRANAGVSLPKL